MKRYLTFILILGCASCSTPQQTLTPPHVTQTQASFDGNDQDSGVKEFVPGKGFVISDAAMARYNDLIIKYKETLVGLHRENGVNYLDNEGMVLFLDLVDREHQK